MAQAQSLMEQKARPALLRFEVMAVEDKAASLKAGHYMAKDVEYVTVKAQGGVDDVTYKVSTWQGIMERDVAAGVFPQTWWDRYQAELEAWRKKQDLPVNGTAIKGWPVIGPSQQETLLRLDIRTVEDLALMNDEAASRVGMGSLDLKNKAKAWLAQAQDKGKLTQEMAALQQTNTIQKGQIETLMRQVEAMRELLPKKAREQFDAVQDEETNG